MSLNYNYLAFPRDADPFFQAGGRPSGIIADQHHRLYARGCYSPSYMLRGFILLVVGTALALMALPFVVTSRALDAHGITIPGRISHKSETVGIVYSDWERSRDATIEYHPPEIGSVSFFDIHPDVPQYDALHTGQAVELRYLLPADVPHVPMARMLREIHALPTVRPVNVREASKLESMFHGWGMMAAKLLGGLAVLFVFWRVIRWPALGWATAIGFVAAMGLFQLEGFPRRTPPPVIEVRRGAGRVTNVGRIDKLFSGAHQRGFVADQPVEVVAVEFVPEGKTEPVVAVDLIDSGSVPGLKEKGAVSVLYEADSPRTARIAGATRDFPERNSKGLVVQGVLCLALAIAMLAIWQWISGAFRRALAR